MIHEFECAIENGMPISIDEIGPINLTFQLSRGRQEPSGQLIMNSDGRLEFKGDVEESAKVFFAYLCENFRMTNIEPASLVLPIRQINTCDRAKGWNDCLDMVVELNK